MMTKRLSRWLRRKDDPAWVAMARRVMSVPGGAVRCDSCGGTGPARATAVVWRVPLEDGGSRSEANSRVWCKGCLAASVRTEYLQCASVTERQATYSPVHVIECEPAESAMPATALPSSYRYTPPSDPWSGRRQQRG
jgi:hypothetical protein